MMKRYIIIQLLTIVLISPLAAQANQQNLSREITLYNPYKPSLSIFKKRSFLPEINDTSRTRPDIKYDITIKPYSPEYSISPIKAASLVPDPLPKLYKSYLVMGLGNYITPLAELNISNERSKKGSAGFSVRHFSSNGKVKLDNSKRVFAGYMDNDASLFGKKFFRYNILEGSLDFSQKVRYAYGYDTAIIDYTADKKDIRLGYINTGASLSLGSLNLDSAKLSYDFDLDYHYFYNARYLDQHNIRFEGALSKSWKGFYAGSDMELDFTRLNDSLSGDMKYITSVSPYIKKNTSQWNFRLGLQMLLDKNMTDSPEFHIYPDVNFGFSIVPAYIGFFASLKGKLKKNSPACIIKDNPFIITDGSLFRLPNTDDALIFSTGLLGNNGIGGNYLISGSYSIINRMLFYSNFVYPDSVPDPMPGNLFIPMTDDAEVLNIHGEMNGQISDKLSYMVNADWYRYTLTENPYAWNKPDWDSRIGLKYNLRDKILAGVNITALGKRKLAASDYKASVFTGNTVFNEPVHVNINLSAEYRYTKILSFWMKLNNISFNRYYEWAYYPSQRFLCLLGFTYSL